MKTFIVGKAKVLGDCVKLTPAQYAAAKVVRAICLTPDELMDLMDHIGNEVPSKLRSKKKLWTPSGGEAVRDDWLPKPVAPSVKVPASNPPALHNMDNLTWQQIADQGPDYKIGAIKKLRATDPEYTSLIAAKERVEEYMDGIDGAL